MANSEHLAILKQGVKKWNRWRDENPYIRPNLNQEDLRGIELSNANFIGAEIAEANLCKAKLNGARFERADLRSTKFCEAELCQARLTNTDLGNADLASADLSEADLFRATIYRSNLSGAKLNRAGLTLAVFNGANLINTDLSEAVTNLTTFSDTDLSKVIGLETVKHNGPSTIGVDTLYKSGGKIPELFLRGCGAPDELITYIPSLVRQAIQYYSCFISYSSKDQAFAERLHADLQSKGVRCWFAPEDLKIGDKFRFRIDESIRVHEKLLLILSENSVASDWVEKEVETAMEQERENKKTVLFPVRLDDSVNAIKSGWAADVRRTRHICDFSKWKSHDEYGKGFERLLRDLKVEEDSHD